MDANLRIGIDNRGAVAPARVIAGSLADVKRSALGAVGAIAALAGIGSTLAIVRKAVDTYRMLETALIGVGKTSNMAGKDLAQFGLDVQNLARRLPVAQQELLNIAEVAAQLGVQGSDNLLKFSETVAKLGRTSNLQGEAAATALARILNVTKEGMGEVDRLASVIVRLGNSSAATEAEIADMSTEIAKATSLFGFSASEAAGYSAALKDIGAEAELSSTTIFSALSILDSASRKGSEGMAVLEQITGMTGAAFRTAFKENAADALTIFLEGLNRLKTEGHDVSQWMQQFGLDGVRAGKVLPPLAANVDKLREYLAAARGEWKENGAMMKEFGAFSESTDSQLQKLTNVIQIFFQEVGRGSNEGLRELVATLNELTASSGGIAKALGSAIGNALIVLSNALRLIVEHGTEVKLILGALAVYKFKGIIESIGPLTEASRLISHMGVAGARLVAINIGSSLVSGFQAALAAINPVYLVIVAIAATVLLVTKNLNEAHAAFLKNTDAANKWAGEVTRLRALLADGKVAVKGADVASAQTVLTEMRELAAQIERKTAAYKPSAMNNLNGKAEDNRQQVAELASMNEKIRAQVLLVDQLRSAYEAAGGAAGEALDKAAADELEKQRLRDASATADLAARNLDYLETIKTVTQQLRTEGDVLAATQAILKSNAGSWDRSEAAIAAATAVISAGIKPTSDIGKKLIEMALANEKVRISLDRSKGALADRKAAVDALKQAEEQAAEARISRMRQLQQDRIRELQGVRNAGVDAKRELEDAYRWAEARKIGAEALRKLNIELEIERRLRALDPDDRMDHTTAAWLDTAQAIRDAVTAQSDLAHESEKTAAAWGRLSQWGGIFASIAANFGPKIAGMVKAAESFANAMQQAAAVQSGDIAGAAAAGMGVGQSIFDFGQSAGLWQGNRGKGGFGGQLSGDYADTGAQVGAVIGAIIGSFWGATAAGAAIGGAAGGAIGGMIKKGADEGLAAMSFELDKFVIGISKSEGGLGSVLEDMAYGIRNSLMDVIDSIGGTLKSMPDVDFKLRDDIISVFVNGIVRRFKSMDEAASFAIAELLKTSEIAGLDEMIKQVLRGSSAGNLEQLKSDLQAVEEVISFGLTDSQESIRGFTSELDGLARKMTDLLGPTEQLTRALGDIATEELSRWGALRDQITGHQQTNAELRAEKERDAQMFNAEKALRIAELEMRRTDLLSQAETLRAQLEITKARNASMVADIIIGKFVLEREAEMLGWRTQLYQAEAALTQQLAVIAQTVIAIGQVITGLQNMPDIRPGEIRIPGANSGGSSGPSKAELRADFLEEVDKIERLALPAATQGVLELADRLREMARRAEELGVSEERIAAARQVLIDQQKEAIRAPIQQYLEPWQGGTRGLSDWQAQAGEIARAFDEARAANQELIDETGQRAITFWELNAAELAALRDLALDAIDSLGLPLEGTRDQIGRWQQALDFLRESMNSGAISAAEYGNVIAEVAQQAEVQFLSLAQSILEQMGNTTAAEEVKRRLEEANFLMQIAQLNLLYDALLALGDVGTVLRERLAPILGWINDEENWPDFSRPSRPNAGAGGNANAADELASLRESVLDRIEKWNDLKLSPAERQLKALNKEFAQLEIDARKAGVSMDLVREAFNAALADFWDGLLTPLRDFLDDLALSDLSTLTPEQRLNEAQARFNDIAGRARAGDLEALQLLPGAAQALLDEARSFFAGSEGFTSILNTVQAVIEQILGQHGLAVPQNPAVGGSGNPLLNPSGTSRDTPATGGTPAPYSSPAAGGGDPRVVGELSASRTQAANDQAALRAKVDQLTAKIDALTEELRRRRDGASDNRAAWGAA